MKCTPILLLAVTSLLYLGCGGSESNPKDSIPATSLVYTDPAAMVGEWKLVKDPASTGTRLVLNLVGPSTEKYRGIGFTLQTDPSQLRIGTFTPVNGVASTYYFDAGVFMDKTDVGADEMPPTLQTGGVYKGRLMVGIFQKTDDELWKVASGFPYDGAAARACDRTVLQVALEVDPSLKALPGAALLTVLKARAIPEHVGTYSTRRVQDVTLKVGTLKLQ